MSVCLDGITSEESLETALANIRKQVDVIKKYGVIFTKAVGPMILASLPEVTPESLNVDSSFRGSILPSRLGAHSAVRGSLNDGRNFVAIKVSRVCICVT